MDSLVSTEWLAAHLDDPELVVLDCTVKTEETADGLVNHSGYSEFLEGHIPTAGFADLKGDLCDQSNPVEFSPPTPEAFCAAVGRLGVGDTSRVVLYDAQISAWAARVWWMLRWVGFDRAAILDGGWNAWTAEGREVSIEPPTHPQRYLAPRPRPELIADRDEVRAAITDDSVHLIDTLPAESFCGEMGLYERPGHIPTAINVGGMELVDDSSRYLPENHLRELHEDIPNERIITYCGGGILASSNAFILTRLGYQDVAVYTASLQEWAADPANPMTTAT